MTDGPVIEFASVSKRYGSLVRALDSVSFSLERGRTVAIMGRSGSGKSTLLHLAAGIDTPTAGHVTLLGRALASLTDKRRTHLRRDHIGLVFQFFHLLPHLSVRENVILPALIAGEATRTVQSRADELLERVDLGARRHDRIEQLSGGERQRVAICRALIRRPSLILADEPTGNLDDEVGQLVIELLFDVAREAGSTLLCVTHSLEVARLAQDVWKLHSGHLECP